MASPQHATAPTALADRITCLAESATIKMAQDSRELKNQGFDVADLSLGEPDFDTPEHIKEAGIQAIRDNYSHYTPVPGYLSLRQAIAEKLKRDNNLQYDPSQIVVSTGAKQSIANLILCLCNPGDEVILPAPYWVSYPAMVQLAEANTVTIPTTVSHNFKITPQQLEEAITPNTKAFLFSSPCNPTGAVYSEEELGALAEVFERHPHVTIISDEIYEYIRFSEGHPTIASFTKLKDRTVVANGLSKGVAMTGWRVGYIAAPEQLAKACTKMQGQFTSGTCGIAQKAAETAISSDLSPTFQMRDIFKERKELVLKELKTIDGLSPNKPEGAFYVFPNVEVFLGTTYHDWHIETAVDLCSYLLNVWHVSTVPGDAFGSPGHIRLSYAASDATLKEALDRLKRGLQALC
ncbi:MAG: aspartate aminotransferase [Bacteroidetes bacterium SW_11_45_7]|nr:MAG: aspartate aminotransferase [Bacteroidetes bacterium SW_11_45_7]